MNHYTKSHQLLNKDQHTDELLVQWYNTTGNNEYIGELYRRYKGKMFGKCISMLGNEEEARDAVQDIFIKILANIGNFSGESSFSTWIYRITYNHCIDILRRRGKTRTEELTDSYNNEREEETPYSIILEHKTDILNTIIEELSLDDQCILFLKYKDERSMEEIRAILQYTQNNDITASAIKMRLKRARERAQEKLKAIGGFEI